MTNNITKQHVAIDPRTGLHLRAATPTEIAAYEGQPNKAPFDLPVRMGEVTITVWTGYGERPIGEW